MYLPTRTTTLEPRRPEDDEGGPGGAPPRPPAGGSPAATAVVSPDRSPVRTAPPRRTRNRWLGLDRNVYLLGVNSLITDVSAEMVATVLPLYLVVSFGFGPAQVGVFDGVYAGASALVCVAVALHADRRQRHKRAATAGYALSSVSKLGLLAAMGSWPATFAVVTVDRLGKGIRTAPRDAILSLSTKRSRLGEAFGVHRAMDTAGAVAGPLVAAAVLARDPNGFAQVFAISFFVSLVGLAVLTLLVDDRRVASPSTPATSAADGVPAPSVRPRSWSRRTLGDLWRDDRVRAPWIAGTVLALATPGEVLLFLALQRSSTMGLAGYPLLFVAASVVFLVAAVPIGRLADRTGRGRVLVGGELCLVAALVLVASGRATSVGLIVVVVLVGVHLAASDGVLMSIVAAAVDGQRRTTGLAVMVTTGALAQLFASSAFGALWATVGLAPTAWAFAAALLAAVVVAAWLLARSPAAEGHA